MTKHIAVSAILSALALASACADDGRGGDGGGCGACADLAAGEWQATGDPRIDGILRAAWLFDDRVHASHARTALAVGRIGEAFGVAVDPEAPLEDSAEQVAAAVQEVVDGFTLCFRIDAGPAVADVPFAYRAQIDCLSHFDCAVAPECADAAAGIGGPAPSECAGTCAGSCDGDCGGVCLTPVDGEMCPVGEQCYGACELMEPAECEGTCYGTCDGTCCPFDGEGQCMGPCSGSCTGVCEKPDGPQACIGACTGACGNGDMAGCAGECRGPCSGSCAGACAGPARPPACAADDACTAQDGCAAAAELLGWTALHATRIDYTLVWENSVDEETWTDTALAYSFGVLETELRAVLAARVELETLTTGTAAADAPVQRIGLAMQGLGDAVDAYGLDDCALGCLEDALASALELLNGDADLAMAAAMAQSWLLSPLGDW